MVYRIARSDAVSAPSNVQHAKSGSPIQIANAYLESDAIWFRVFTSLAVAVNEYVMALEFSVTADRTRANDDPEIRMPSQLSLLEYDGDKGLRLDQKVEEYGGYENVARRLGLAFSFYCY